MPQQPTQRQRGNHAMRQRRESASTYYVLGGAVLITIVAFVVYFPALRGGFIMDDDILLSDNTLVRAPDGLHRIWLTTEPFEYYPISYSSLWFEWRLWGKNPIGYRVTNLVLHVAGGLLIWLVLWKLSIPGAYLAALIFVVHPVNVESVAWIAQRRNVLAIVFALLSAFGFIRAENLAPAALVRHSRQTSHKQSLLVFAQLVGIRAGDAEQRLGGCVADFVSADRLVAARSIDNCRSDPHHAVCRHRSGANVFKYLVSDPWLGFRDSPRHACSTLRRRRRGGLVLSGQSGYFRLVCCSFTHNGISAWPTCFGGRPWLHVLL